VAGSGAWRGAPRRKRSGKSGAGQIGTTRRGIGPAYSDKVRRSTALRLGDLLDHALLLRELETRLDNVLRRCGLHFGLEFGHFVDAPENLDQLASSPCHAVAPRVDWKATEAG
jgi:adenylosuccinate synthase